MLSRIRMVAAVAMLGLIGSAGLAAEPAAVPVVKSDIVQVGWDGPPGPGGCANCAAPVRPAGGLLGGLTIGEGCRNQVGCGTLATERTFLFGGCNQFFNAGHKCRLCGKGAYGVGGGLCTTGPCVYGTALNR